MENRARSCPHCGVFVGSDASFCPRCGAGLGDAPGEARSAGCVEVILAALTLGFGLSGACYVGFGAFGFPNRDIGFPPSAPMTLLGLALLGAAAGCVYAMIRLHRRRR